MKRYNIISHVTFSQAGRFSQLSCSSLKAQGASGVSPLGIYICEQQGLWPSMHVATKQAVVTNTYSSSTPGWVGAGGLSFLAEFEARRQCTRTRVKNKSTTRTAGDQAQGLFRPLVFAEEVRLRSDTEKHSVPRTQIMSVALVNTISQSHLPHRRAGPVCWTAV